MSATSMSTLPDGPNYLHLTMILYGSTKEDPVSDTHRFTGYDQRRVEIDFRLKLPRLGMTLEEIQFYAQRYTALHHRSIKHTQKWYCVYCDKPAQMSQIDMVSWAHLTPPRINFYCQLVCNPSIRRCAERLRATHIEVSLKVGHLPMPPGPIETPSEHPFAGVCAGCRREETMDVPTRKCSACQLTRYCSVACQSEHWREHKAFCKTPKEVKWVWPA